MGNTKSSFEILKPKVQKTKKIKAQPKSSYTKSSKDQIRPFFFFFFANTNKTQPKKAYPKNANRRDPKIENKNEKEIHNSCF